jgi:hypothetical protein
LTKSIEAMLASVKAVMPGAAWRKGDHPDSVTAALTEHASATVYDEGGIFRAEVECGEHFWIGEGATASNALFAAMCDFHEPLRRLSEMGAAFIAASPLPGQQSAPSART